MGYEITGFLSRPARTCSFSDQYQVTSQNGDAKEIRKRYTVQDVVDLLVCEGSDVDIDGDSDSEGNVLQCATARFH